MPKLGKKNCHGFGKPNMRGLTSFGSQPNNDQNHGLSNLWFGKFWKPAIRFKDSLDLYCPICTLPGPLLLYWLESGR
jgi:hypothetical protein